MRELLEWMFVGGLIGFVGWQALRIAESFVPVRAVQDMKQATTIAENRQTIPMNSAFHPDSLGVSLEESFQQWAQQQRAKDREEESKP